jgi:hypothetical protein
MIPVVLNSTQLNPPLYSTQLKVIKWGPTLLTLLQHFLVLVLSLHNKHFFNKLWNLHSPHTHHASHQKIRTAEPTEKIGPTATTKTIGPTSPNKNSGLPRPPILS